MIDRRIIFLSRLIWKERTICLRILEYNNNNNNANVRSSYYVFLVLLAIDRFFLYRIYNI